MSIGLSSGIGDMKKKWRGHNVEYQAVAYGDGHQPEWLWMLKFNNTEELIFVEADTLFDAVKHCGKTTLHVRRATPVQWLIKAEVDSLRLAVIKQNEDKEEKRKRKTKEAT